MLKLEGNGAKNGKPVKLVVLGLSHTNLARLKDGQPIVFSGEEVGLPDVEFTIFAGKTEQAMARDLADLVGANTIVRIDPRFKD